MQPHGWRESITSERTTFRFSNASVGRRIGSMVVMSPLWIIGVSMTIASIRAGDWGGGYCFVAGWDALAGLMAFVALDAWGRTRIVFEEGHVTWTVGPFPRTRARMTLFEATSILAQERRAARSVYWMFSFLRNDAKKSLGTALDDGARASYVLERIDAEIIRRDPTLQTRAATFPTATR